MGLSLPNRIRKAFGHPYATALSAPALKPPDKVRKRSLPANLNRGYNYMVKMEIDQLEAAIIAAERPGMPNRQRLYAIYRETQRDDTVRSQMRTAKIRLLRSPVEVRRNGEVDDDLTKLTESKWFTDLTELWLDTEIWGHSLIELYPVARRGEISFDVTLIDREHVVPEHGKVSLDGAALGDRGISFRQNKEYPYLLEMGGERDLGVMASIAKPVIRKRYSDGDWSLFSERFGMPLLSIKTQAVDDAEITKREKWAQNFGAAGYVITDDQDEVEFLTPNMVGTGHYVFRDRIDYADKQIDKLINGQTSTSNEKAHVGAAEVHERVMDDFCYARLRKLHHWQNNDLLDFLDRIGFGWGEGVEIVNLELERKDEDEGAEVDPPEPDKPEQKEKPQPGKPVSLSLSASLSAYFATPLTDDATALAYYFPRDEVDAWMKRTAALAPGELDRAAYRQIAGRMMAAAGDGLGVDLTRIDLTAANGQQLKKLRDSLSRFTAAKLMSARDAMDALPSHEIAARTAIARQHLNQWTEVEERAVLAQAQTTKRYLELAAEDPKQLMRYSTVGDGLVRDAHKALNGIVRPLDDDFWKEHWPPNDWNCRCTVETAADGMTDVPEEVANEPIPPGFRNNPGVSGEFMEGHPYHGRTNPALVDQAAEDASTELALFDKISDDVYIHPQRPASVKSDIDQRDLDREIDTAQRIVKATEHQIELGPELGGTHIGGPDGYALIDDVRYVAEIKNVIGKRSTLQSQIKKGFKQASQVVYIDYGTDVMGKQLLASQLVMTYEEAINAVRGQWLAHKGSQDRFGVILLYPGREPVVFK